MFPRSSVWSRYSEFVGDYTHDDVTHRVESISSSLAAEVDCAYIDMGTPVPSVVSHSVGFDVSVDETDTIKDGTAARRLCGSTLNKKDLALAIVSSVLLAVHIAAVALLCVHVHSEFTSEALVDKSGYDDTIEYIVYFVAETTCAIGVRFVLGEILSC